MWNFMLSLNVYLNYAYPLTLYKNMHGGIFHLSSKQSLISEQQ